MKTLFGLLRALFLIAGVFVGLWFGGNIVIGVITDWHHWSSNTMAWFIGISWGLMFALGWTWKAKH